MRLYETLSEKENRVEPKNWWNSLTANVLSKQLGDIYHDQKALLSCYSSDRKHMYDELDYPKILKQYCKDFRENDGYNHPFIIYGPPGVGKTTYIAHKLETISDKEFHIIPFIFDLRNVSDLSHVSIKFISELHKFLKNYLDSKIIKDNGPDYKIEYLFELFSEKQSNQIIEFDEKDIYSALSNNRIRNKAINIIEERYLTNEKLVCVQKLRYLFDRYKTQVAFVLDNFDHFEEYKKTHTHVYALAKEVISDFQSPSFLPMRNNTLLDSYDIYGYKEADKARTKSLSGVKARGVLEKRVKYISDNLDDRIKSGKLEISSEVLANEIKNVLEGVIKNKLIIDLLSGLSGNNTRTLLWFLELALQSGHLDTSPKTQGDELNKYKAFIKACSYCNHLIFTPTESRSPMVNVFDNGVSENSLSMFSRVRILQILVYYKHEIEASEIVNKLEVLGCTENVVLADMKSMINKGLIRELPYLSSKIIKLDNTYKITSIGRFYIEKLILDPIYFETMAPSLNITKNLLNHLTTIRNDSIKKKDIENRYQSLISILEHMEEQEKHDHNLINDCDHLDKQIWPDIVSPLKRAVKKQWNDRFFQKYKH